MAYNRRKRKVKKNIPEAQAHIKTSYNNSVISITDNDGNVIAWASSGTIGYKGSKKKTAYAAQMAAEAAGLEITSISDVTPVPHNGCRPPKRPRI